MHAGSNGKAHRPTGGSLLILSSTQLYGYGGGVTGIHSYCQPTLDFPSRLLTVLTTRIFLRVYYGAKRSNLVMVSGMLLVEGLIISVS